MKDVEHTTDEIYDELRQLRLTAEQIAENIADVASAVQYFTNNLFDEQHNPDLSDIVREMGDYLAKVAAVATEQAVDQVNTTAEGVDLAVNELLREQQGKEAGQEGEETRENPIDEVAEQQMLFGGEKSGDALAVADASDATGSGKLAEAVDPEHSHNGLLGVGESTVDGLGSGSVAPSQSELPPYTLDDYRAFCDRRGDLPMTANEWQAEYQRLRQSKPMFLAHLKKNSNAQMLKVMALRTGTMHAKQQTKEENALSIYRACLRGFVLGNSIQYSPMEETIEDAIDRIVNGLTDEEFARCDTERQSKEAEHRKAIKNPESLTEFVIFVREMGEDKLTDEQHLRRDRLYAELSRETRAQQKPTSVSRFEASEIDGLEFSVKQGYHEKRDCSVWIVQLSARVDRSTYGELKSKAQQLGGWYSSFKKTDAGFQFLSQEAAEKFTGLQEGDVDRSEQVEDQRIRKMTNTAERFNAMADRITEESEATLAADDHKLKNTVRRAEQAASTRATAREGLASAATLRSLATQLSEGQATFLDGVRYANQISTLKSLLRRAKWKHVTHRMDNEFSELTNFDRHRQLEELEGQPVVVSDVRFAEYPKPNFYRRHLTEAFAKLRNTKGLKQITVKMEKRVARLSPGSEYVEFHHAHDIEQLEAFLDRAKAAGHNNYWFEDCLEATKRLQRASIHTDHELRAALAELVPHLRPADADDPVTQALDELRGKQLPGFFPTPKPVIYEMLEYADIQPGDRVLEPSCGCGDILDVVHEHYPDAQLQAVEQNLTLAPVLAAKGHEGITVYEDFLAYQWRCDKVLMNPPFERGAEIDHVRHAYEQLAVEGRLVSVVSVGPFSRSDAKSREFREWLDELDHEVHQLPEKAFAGVESFRQTGVRTCLVVIDKA